MPKKDNPSLLSRRNFLKLAGLGAAGAMLAGCQPALPPTPIPTATPSATAKAAYRVAIGRAQGYDLPGLRQTVTDLLDQLGGLGDVIRPGARVAVKTNLVGGSSSMGRAATERYITHPAVVQVLFERLRDAGASKLYLVEAIWNAPDLEVWGYRDILKPLNIEVVDLNQTAPYSDWGTFTVGAAHLIYPDFTLNHILGEVDAFISVPKMKCHSTCGVTNSMKNLVGLTPITYYNDIPGGVNRRNALHGPDDIKHNQRLPRVIVDLNRARPIHLALIDGIKTVEGGEGPWVETMRAMQPGILLAGKNPVATDAVATAAMGFDPQAEHPAAPFLHADNYLQLASQAGLGSNRLEDIEVVGTPIEEIRLNFQAV